MEKIVFARKNNFLKADRVSVAHQKLELNVHRQLPSLYYQTRTLFGIKFDKVEKISNEKLHL